MITRPILACASAPFPSALSTLDAIRLTTALVWQQEERKQLVMATRDIALGITAQACGLRVVGL